MQRHDEEKQVVVLTAEDVKNVKDFFTHFKLKAPDMVTNLIEKMEKDPKSITFEDQKRFRAAIAYAMNTIDHPLVKDNAFANIRAKCEKAWFDAKFEMDIDEVLREPKTTT